MNKRRNKVFTSTDGNVRLSRGRLCLRGYDTSVIFGWDDARMQAFVDVLAFKLEYNGIIQRGEIVPKAGRYKNSWRRVAVLMILDGLVDAM